jgi:hypothetical protein
MANGHRFRQIGRTGQLLSPLQGKCLLSSITVRSGRKRRNLSGGEGRQSTHSGRWSQRGVNGGFRGPAVIRARLPPVKSSAAVRITANFIAREWRLTQRPYDLLTFDPSPTLENGKLDTVERPLSDRLQVSALSLAQRSLIYDARQSA